jgi:FdhD protein
MTKPVRRTATTRTTILQVQGESSHKIQEWLTVEEPLEIRLVAHGQRLPGAAISVTMRTPGHDFELAAGFLYTEGIIPGREAIKRITYCVSEQDGSQQYNIVNLFLAPGIVVDPQKLTRNFYMTSSCGVCGKASLESVQVKIPNRPADSVRITTNVISSLPDRLRAAQAVFERTGGLHAAALFNLQGELVDLREDVGRHNAVDKLIGHALLQGQDITQQILMVSGRTSFEIIQKAAVAGLPVVAAISAPSSLAVDLANAVGITLVGFMREGRFNLYGGAERLVSL